MFVIESCQKIEYNVLFMMIFIPVSNFGDQPLDEKCELNLRDNLIKVDKGGLQHSTKDKNFSSLYVYHFTRFEFLII